MLNAEDVDPNPAAKERLNGRLPKLTDKTEALASLPWQQVPALMVRIAAEPDIHYRALRFVILTGVRVNEALEADWSEFDLTAKVWTIPAVRSLE